MFVQFINFMAKHALGAEVLSFGQGAGPIWLNNVQCTGIERTLMNCTASSNRLNSCTHDQDVGVRCLPGYCLAFIIIITCYAV